METIQIPNEPENKELIEFLEGLDGMGTIVLPSGERLLVIAQPSDPNDPLASHMVQMWMDEALPQESQ